MGDSFKIEKLNDNNYRYWKMEVQGLLEEKGVWEAVEPGYGAEPTAAQKKADHKAKSALYLSINKSAKDDVMHCVTAKEVWDTLAKVHTQYDLWHSALLVKDYVTTQKLEDESIVDYLTRRNGLYQQISGAGFTFPEKTQCIFTILGLPPQYEFLCRSLQNGHSEQDVGDLSHARIKSKLLEEERRIKQQDPNNRTALNTWRNRNDYSNDRDVRRDSKQGMTKENDECYTCDNYGHHSHECKLNTHRRKQRMAVTNNDKCQKCDLQDGKGQRGSQRLRKSTKSKASDSSQSSQSDTSQFPRDSSSSGSDSPEETSRKPPGKKRSSKKKTPNLMTANSTKAQDGAGIALLASKDGVFSDYQWVLDSGTTKHLCKNPEKMSQLRGTNEEISPSHGKTLKANGEGKVIINFKDNHQIPLEKVLLMPGIKANLLSVSVLIDDGYKVKFYKRHALIIDADNQIISKGKRQNKLYIFNEKPMNQLDVQGVLENHGSTPGKTTV
jgi:hypothetical protein